MKQLRKPDRDSDENNAVNSEKLMLRPDKPESGLKSAAYKTDMGPILAVEPPHQALTEP